MHLCDETDDEIMEKMFEKLIVPYLEAEESIGKQYWRDQAISKHKLLERVEPIMRKHIISESSKKFKIKLAKIADELQKEKYWNYENYDIVKNTIR